MHDPLRHQARRAYERGRWARALPWISPPLGLAAVALALHTSSAALAVGLGLAVALGFFVARVRGGELARVVPGASLLGGLGFFLSVAGVVGCCATGCRVDDPWIVAACGGAGLTVGLGLGVTVRRRGLAAVLGAFVLTAALATLGCAGAGLGAGLGLVVAIGLGLAPALVGARIRSA